MNNENNNDVYREDNSFNNQGIVDSPDQTEPVEQQQTQFPSANRRQNNFGNIAQGLPGKLRNNENNPALGGPKNNNPNNNPAKGQKKPNSNNQNKKDGLGDKNNNQNKNKNNNNNNKKRNPLPGGGTNKKDDRRGNQPGPKKDNDNNKKSPLAGMNPFARRREMLKSRFGMGRDKKESGTGGASPNLNQAKTSILKKAWMMAPIQVKVVTIVILPALIVLGLILIGIFGGTTAATVASMCGETEYNVNGTDATEFLCSMTSPFGENKYTVSSTSGWRIHPKEGKKKFHYGTDVYVNGSDLSIYAVQAGTIEEIKYNDGWGNTILINHGNFTTRYAHLSKFESGLKKGDKVTQGQKIGTEGTTGNSTGNHLHLELRDKEGNYLSANPFFGYSDQGYEDCIDPSANGDLNKCDFKTSKEARYIGEEGFNQICGKTGNYTTSDNSDCCETDNQGTGDSKNIREFINIFEGSGPYCDNAKTKYKSYQNAGDRVTIGHGVTSDYIKGLKLGQCISVSEVDAAEDRAIDAKRNGVIKPKFIGVNLEKHQEDALTSMAFNGCGTYFKGIATAAQEGNLEKVWQAMKGCTNGGKLGLQRRRKAEFALYVTGDYNVANEYKSKTWTKSQYDDYDSDGVVAKKATGTSSTCTESSSSGSGDVVERANEEYDKWNKASSSERSELLKNYMESCGFGRKCNAWCAGFVTYILKETGKLDNVKGYNCTAYSYKNVQPAEHHKRGSSYTPKPGDVIVFSYSHVALVEKVEGKTVHYIGGNQSGKNSPSCWRNAITKNTIAVDSSKVYEYVSIG